MLGSTFAMLGSALYMAMRELRRNVLRSALTTLGIVIGVGAVIALVTLGQGATDKITADIASMGVNMLMVSPGTERHGPTSASAPPLTLDDVHAIDRDVKAVAVVAPTSTRSVLVVYANKNYNTMLTGSSGCQMRRNATMATIDSRDATMSVSSTER